MFVVLVYDAAAIRDPLALKACRRYLHWVQNSVFQGELSDAQLRSLKDHLAEIVTGGDNILIYKVPVRSAIGIETIGTTRGHVGEIL